MPDYAEAVIALEEVKREIASLEVMEKQLVETVNNGRKSGELSDDEIKVYGLMPSVRSGGYDDGIVSLLKKKDLRDAIETKEKAIAKMVKEYEEQGVLTADEVEPYKKPDSLVLSLPKTKKE